MNRRNFLFGSAAARLQSVNDADNDDPAQTIYCLSWAKFGRGYTEADFDDLQTLLTEAKEAAKNDPVVLKRVGFLQTGLDFTRARIRLYNLCYGRARGTKPEIQAAAQKQYDIMVKAGMTTPHALSVGHIAWWDRNCWGKCGWKPDPAKMPRDPGARTTKKRGGSRKVWN